jgi:hypothetical protein
MSGAERLMPDSRAGDLAQESPVLDVGREGTAVVQGATADPPSASCTVDASWAVRHGAGVSLYFAPALGTGAKCP